ncbi:probable ATP-dependent RNA helicase CG8611 [Phymastichus coffea]|uniref:probable ATP-dependent RNA helicase CG8611 n=1 Tax=Phymastichus coffea TaxID=108790 RepID=UPI00273AF363|nr:probable ATP-dependent RNA helicase CG8611 [Phymastichus coffea]XP_058800028.1 probable ATP-dependent RNA helicase CG8611 [Phymastichus coffea]
MAVKDDMDICLNIAGGTVNSKKQTPKIPKDMHIKRMKTKQYGKKKNTLAKAESIHTIKSSFTGAKQRIKQKCLATLVAKNSQKVKVSSAVPKASILKKSDSITSSKSSSLFTSQVTNNKQLTNDKKVSFSAKAGGDSSKPVISFVKTSKENTLKTILARKRKIDTREEKKSLSDIFKTSNLSEANLSKNKVNEDRVDNIVSDKQLKFDFGQKNSKNYDENSKKIPMDKDSNFPKKIKKFNDKARFHKEHNDSKSENVNHNFHPKGKIASLFGHNPEIPHIGQRFVKPVNEKVFSAEKFSELGIHAYAVSNLEQNMNITTMTTVQKKAIPVILSGHDVLVRSQTGSGKTLAYALPIIESLQSIKPKLSRNDGTRALVIVPTRELALQTYECFLKLVKPFTWIVPGYLMGGEKRKAEKARLRKGCVILVATPGRLIDHIKHTNALKLDRINCLVLDEADRMLDMGYEKDISEIVATLTNTPNTSSDSSYDALAMLRKNIKLKGNNLSEIKTEHEENDEENKYTVRRQNNSEFEENSTNGNEPKSAESQQNNELGKSAGEENSNENKLQRRKTILLSATLTHAVEKLAGLTMYNPVFVDAAKENIENSGGIDADVNEDLVVPQSVTQSYIVTPPKLRLVTLSAYIAGKCQQQGSHKIIVFVATQDMVDFHTETLSTVLTKPTDAEDEDSDPLVDIEFFKLHGNMSHKERTDIFKTFRQAKSGVLFCTDVAARGLDLPEVDIVVQYTGPTSTRDYVHRIGRTARAGSSGTATIFLTPSEVEFVRMLEARKIRIKQDDMDDVLNNLIGPLSPHNSVHAAAIALQNNLEELVLENKKYHTLACKAYTSWVQFYSSYPREMRQVFNRKNLHLGHYAKSFALRDPPSKIGGAGKAIRQREIDARPKHQNRLSNQREERRKDSSKQQGAGGQGSLRQQDRRNGMLKNVRMLNISEFDSGLEPIKKTKK